MVRYDPQIIQQFADRMYAQASQTVIVSAILVALVGAAIGVGVGDVLGDPRIGAIAFGGIGAVLGFALGQQRAFALRLQAQQALCQVQIETNTNGGPAHGSVAPKRRVSLGMDTLQTSRAEPSNASRNMGIGFRYELTPVLEDKVLTTFTMAVQSVGPRSTADSCTATPKCA